MKLARTSGLAFIAALILATPAIAHQPVALSALASKANASPILVDGTTSFAVTATMSASSLTRAFRFFLQEGERVEMQYLILDKKPENQLSASNLPQVTFTSPDGKSTKLSINERTPFYEPFGKKNYLYLSRFSAIGQAGTYIVTIQAKRASSVVIAVGVREVSGIVLLVGKSKGACPAPLRKDIEIPAPLAKQFIGMTERSALACASANSWGARVVSRDGEEFPVTMDYRIDRLNFTIKSDRVTQVSVG